MPRTTFHQLLREETLPLLLPCVFDAIGAKLAEQIGFQAIGVTGFGVAATFGRPDVGITSLAETVERVRHIASNVDIPVLADGDDGYGNPISVRETIRQLEAAGAAGIHIEDQQLPKKCGSMEGKKIVPIAEMVQKIRAAVDARRSPDLFVVARTDATSTGDWDDAVARCVAYAEAGADAVMPMAPGTPEQMRRFTQAVKVPVIMIMGESEHWVRHHELLHPNVLREIGFSIVAFPTSILFAYVHATRVILRTIKERGTTKSLLEQMASFQEVTNLLGLPKVYELEALYSVS